MLAPILTLGNVFLRGLFALRSLNILNLFLILNRNFGVYNLQMRPSYAIFSVALFLQLIVTSCASRMAPASPSLLPKPLARLHPGASISPLNLHPTTPPEQVATTTPPGVSPPEVFELADAVAPEHDELEGDGPEEAEEFMRRVRLPGGGPLETDRYLSARRHAEGMRHFSIATGRFVTGRGGLRANSLSAPKDLTGGWVSLGPGNVGGRTRSLVINPVDPNIMFAGAVAGGVWKSLDGGASWNPLTDLVPTDYIAALAMSPTDPNTVYAGTGESLAGDGRRGLGILKTTDGGATWTRLPATANSSFNYVNKIVITPGGSIYAATSTGVYQSLNGGANWTSSLAKSYCDEMTLRQDVQADFLFANCSTTTSQNGPFAIYRNSDAAGAGTWENVFTTTGMARTSLAIAPSQPTTIYAMAWSSSPQPTNATGLIGVFRSLSSGDTGSWTTQTSNKDSNRLNTALLSYPECAGECLFREWCRCL